MLVFERNHGYELLSPLLPFLLERGLWAGIGRHAFYGIPVALYPTARLQLPETLEDFAFGRDRFIQLILYQLK